MATVVAQAMFSAQSTLFQIQSPPLCDCRPPKTLRYGKHFQKTQTHNKNITDTEKNNIHCFAFKKPSVLSHSETSFPTSTHLRELENHKCFAYFDPLLVSGDSCLLAHWLQACSTVNEVRRIHAIVLKCLKSPDIYVHNNLISGYARHGALVEARKVFDRMLERNVVSWTAMLNGYLKFGSNHEALRYFVEFVESGLCWNSKTFVCVLNMCGKSLNFELGKQVHACVIKSSYGGLILDSAILYFYAHCGDLENAFLVFDQMKERDVICWTTMITAYSQHGCEEEGFMMFSRMLSEGFEPNEYTVCSVLDACGEQKQLKLGRQLHGAIIKRMYKMDIFVGSSLVDMYAKCGEMEDSRAVFDGMRRRNTVTWTTVLAGYARNGLGDEAISLFRVMQRRRISANNLTMVSILRACGSLGALPTGKEVHAQAIKNFVQSNIYIGSALVWLYCSCGDYSAASKVLQDMPLRDVVSWTSMIAGCARLGHEYEALKYLKEMLGEGIDPNPFTYSSALKACAQLEDVRQGKLIHSSINKTPSSSNVFVGSALIHMYAKCGYLFEAVRVFDNMPERNLVSWKAMIVAYARNNLCREAFKLMYRMQAEGIELDDYILAAVLTSCGDLEWDIGSTSKHEFQSYKSLI